MSKAIPVTLSEAKTRYQLTEETEKFQRCHSYSSVVMVVRQRLLPRSRALLFLRMLTGKMDLGHTCQELGNPAQYVLNGDGSD
jgi:hypothetical protein